MSKVVYWHRELPPLDGEVLDEHVVEAVSDRVRGAIERHGESWDHCYAQLMDHARSLHLRALPARDALTA